jgi:hypothetical protein
MHSFHTGYTVPAGDSQLRLSQGIHDWTDVRFIFGGAPNRLRINSIAADCTGVFFSFDNGATPHEATVFFATNPFPAGRTNQMFSVAVTNLSSGDESLQLTVLGNPPVNPPLDPPCGL